MMLLESPFVFSFAKFRQLNLEREKWEKERTICCITEGPARQNMEEREIICMAKGTNFFFLREITFCLFFFKETIV